MSAYLFTRRNVLQIENVEKISAADVGALYDRYAPELYRYIYHRLGAKTFAEDLTAEVFVRVLNGERRVNDWRAYLYRIAHNLVIDAIRKHPHVLQEPDEFLPDERNDPVEHAEVRDEQRRLRQAIARLTPEQQQVVVLKFIEEMSNAQVAKILNKPEGAVKALQHRALTNLRAWLGAEQPAPRAWNRWNESQVS
jgi:RNA polymerase sigma-70 factor (ECF subfamily)